MPTRPFLSPSPLFSEHAVLQGGLELPIWGTGSEGEKVCVEIAGQKAEGITTDGRWKVSLPPLPPGGPYRMTISSRLARLTFSDILIGEVWLCGGQSNMARILVPPETVQPRAPHWLEEAAIADYPSIRYFRVENEAAECPESDVQGRWEVCTPQTVPNFNALGYFFARGLHLAQGVPVGIVNTAVGSTRCECWIDRPTLESTPQLAPLLQREQEERERYPERLKDPSIDPKTVVNPFTDPFRNSAFYHGKVAPLAGLAVRGILWYQGESNCERPDEYALLFPMLIRRWRQLLGRDELPFLFVQLPEYRLFPPEIREIQRNVHLATPHTEMVVTTDCGDANDIHPADKRPVAARLLLTALGAVYQHPILFRSPSPTKVILSDSKLVVHFDHCGDGLIHEGEIKGFEIAETAEGPFLPAEAQLAKECVTLSHSKLSSPQIVRYNWASVPEGKLSNSASLPATPFQIKIDLSLNS